MAHTSVVTAHDVRVGWRLGVGAALIVAGYAVLALLPTVSNCDLPKGVRSALTGLILISPLMSKVVAVGVMGKAGFDFLKQKVLGFLGHAFGALGNLQPAQTVSRSRYHAGLITLGAAFLFGELLPYFPGILIDWNAHETLWSFVADAVMMLSLFILGGDFWEKLRALFDYDAKVVFAEQK